MDYIVQGGKTTAIPVLLANFAGMAYVYRKHQEQKDILVFVIRSVSYFFEDVLNGILIWLNFEGVDNRWNKPGLYSGRRRM